MEALKSWLLIGRANLISINGLSFTFWSQAFWLSIWNDLKWLHRVISLQFCGSLDLHGLAASISSNRSSLWYSKHAAADKAAAYNPTTMDQGCTRIARLCPWDGEMRRLRSDCVIALQTEGNRCMSWNCAVLWICMDWPTDCVAVLLGRLQFWNAQPMRNTKVPCLKPSLTSKPAENNPFLIETSQLVI